MWIVLIFINYYIEMFMFYFSVFFGIVCIIVYEFVFVI